MCDRMWAWSVGHAGQSVMRAARDQIALVVARDVNETLKPETETRPRPYLPLTQRWLHYIVNQ